MIEVDAMLAESTVSAEGRLFVLGGGFAIAEANSFPVFHPRLSLAITLRMNPLDLSQKHEMSISIVSPNGSKLSLGQSGPGQPTRYKLDFPLQLPSMPPGDNITIPVAVNLDGLSFPIEGSYTLHLSLDNQVVKRLSFLIRTRQK